MKFKSPTYGVFETTKEVVRQIISKVEENLDSEWTIAIGTDSQNQGDQTKFCTAILLLGKGRGGIYFYSVHSAPRFKGLQHRMLKEAEISITVGHEIIEIFEDIYLEDGLEILSYKVNLEIHCDLGKKGESECVINSAIGWITAEFGDKVITRIKPNSPAVSYVADKYTKYE